MARTKQVARKSCSQKIQKKNMTAHKIGRKSATTYTGVVKAKRFRPGTVAMKEIRRYQRTT